jgi:hypothetical protein
MWSLRNIFLIVILVFFGNASLNSAVKDIPVKKDHSIFKIKNPVLIKKHSPVKENYICHFKKKRKTRGIGVSVPQISDALFGQSCSFVNYSPTYSGGKYTAFDVCIHCKRGPPVA